MYTERVQSYTLIGLLAVTAVLTFLIFKPFLTALSLAAIFAVVLYPLQRHFVTWFSGWPGLSAALTILIATLCLLVPLTFLALNVIGEARDTYVSLTQGTGLANTQDAILFVGANLEAVAPGSYGFAEQIASDLNRYAAAVLNWILAHTGDVFSSLLGLMLDLFIFFVALFAFLRSAPSIHEQLLRLSPFRDADDERIFSRLTLTINSVVRGSLAVSVIQGIVATLGYIIFSVPNPLLWGLFTSIASLVPGVGTALIIAPAIGYLLIAGETVSALGLLAWGVAAVGLVDNFLGPILVGRGTQLPSLVILLAVLGGLAFFGPAGIFLGPLTISLLLVLFSLYGSNQRST